jgi:hypothetical protein
MESTIPTDLLDLKTRVEAWRENRKYTREPIPEEFSLAAAEMCQRYSPSLVRRHLNIDPWRLKRSAAKKTTSIRSKKRPAFFQLSPETASPLVSSSAQQNSICCRLQIERPDGSRLTFFLAAIENSTIAALCDHFLRS